MHFSFGILSLFLFICNFLLTLYMFIHTYMCFIIVLYYFILKSLFIFQVGNDSNSERTESMLFLSDQVSLSVNLTLINCLTVSSYVVP